MAAIMIVIYGIGPALRHARVERSSWPVSQPECVTHLFAGERFGLGPAVGPARRDLQVVLDNGDVADIARTGAGAEPSAIPSRAIVAVVEIDIALRAVRVDEGCQVRGIPVVDANPL